MLGRTVRVVPLSALLLALTAGCASESTDQPQAEAPSETAVEAPAPEADTAPERSGDSELAGTSWQLVKIESMDDTVHIPEDASVYTLELGEDESLAIHADCNRGTGSWTSESPGQLEFGVIAATQASCPAGSLHDIYMAQFEWVRSYVLEDGHLFLATMADGSIIEFAPMAEP